MAIAPDATASSEGDHADDLVVAGANHLRQRLAHVLLVIGDQHPHTSRWRNFHANRADKTEWSEWDEVRTALVFHGRSGREVAVDRCGSSRDTMARGSRDIE